MTKSKSAKDILAGLAATREKLFAELDENARLTILNGGIPVGLTPISIRFAGRKELAECIVELLEESGEWKTEQELLTELELNGITVNQASPRHVVLKAAKQSIVWHADDPRSRPKPRLFKRRADKKIGLPEWPNAPQ